MLMNLVELSEDESCFLVSGNAYVYVDKESGLVVMQEPLKQILQKPLIIDFRILGDELYLEWIKGRKIERTYLGQVDGDNSENYHLVDNINRIYKQDACRS